MLKGERLYKLVDYINEKKTVTINELCDYLIVSKATINRDLKVLEEEKLITRTHGGAMSLAKGTKFEPIYIVKERERTKEKDVIASLAVELIKHGETIYLDSGTTTLALAKRLKDISNMTVITNDLKIAYTLCSEDHIELVVLGGQQRKGVYSLLGPFAENTLKILNIDKAFLGADAIDINKGITNSNIDESNLKKSIIEMSNEVIALIDSSKFGNVSFVKVCEVNDVNKIITDSNISIEEVEKFESKDIKLHISNL